MDEIDNEELIEIINEYYIDDDEEKEMELDEKRIKRLTESKEDLIKLLYNENIKVIEIVLNIMIEMRMREIIPKEIKAELLSRLLTDYIKYKRNVTLKCLCLFVDDKRNIDTIENLCGKEILYRILNEEYYLSSKSKELLIKYNQEMKLSEKEEEEMSEIILNKELLEELLIKEITSFSYPQSEYLFLINEEISIIPSFDGNRVEFSITPSLPSGMFIDKESGIINGKIDRIMEKREYEVKCKNIRNEKKFKISLEFIEIKYTELNKGSGITISSNERVIEQTSGNYNHCYINLKMEKGIYHIKIKYLKKGSSCSGFIYLGLSTDNTYSATCIFNQPTTCNYCGEGGESQDITSKCHIGRIVNSNPNFNNHGEGSIYEMIVDMNKREFWISHNNSSPILLVEDLPSPLYPYSAMICTGNKYELLSVSHQN